LEYWERNPLRFCSSKSHCGKLALKIYSKSERVLCIEAVAHNTQELGIDLNKARMRQVVEALIALSASPNGFTARSGAHTQ
jgi:hypothetical protein